MNFLVSKEKFEKRTNKQYPHLCDTYDTNEEFKCGCGKKHYIGKDGVKVIKQVDLSEFVVNCAFGFNTLIQNDFVDRKQFSLMSVKTS